MPSNKEFANENDTGSTSWRQFNATEEIRNSNAQQTPRVHLWRARPLDESTTKCDNTQQRSLPLVLAQ